MLRAVSTALVLSTACGVASAQAGWTSVTSGTPSARAAVISATDIGGMIVFGGNFASGVRSNEVWRLDGTTETWTNLTPAAGPMPLGRHFGAGTVDYGRQKLVIFGGTNDNSTWLGDTWEFDLVTQTWTDVTPATSPSPRRWCQMAYNAIQGNCVLYGGVDQGGTYQSDTWTWDGVSWTQHFPANSPGPLARQRMVQKFPTPDTYLFGGRDSGGAKGETWYWNGADWTQIVTPTIPGPTASGLFAHSLAYDEIRDRFVVHGGVAVTSTLNETWEFDGTDWSMTASHPTNSRSGPALTYVPVAGKTYLYGGFQSSRLDDTWSYQTNAIATFSVGTNGQGCPGSGGVTPTLSGATLPWTDSTFEIQVQSLDPGANVRAMVFNFGPPIAPISLAVIGFPACSFLAGPSLSTLLGAGDVLALPIPDDNALAGWPMSFQAFGIEFGTGVISSSDRADIAIGVR